MILAAHLLGCRGLSAADWLGPSAKIEGDTSDSAPTEHSPPPPRAVPLESLSVIGWLGPNASSRFGTAMAAAESGELAVTAPQSADRPGQIYLIDVPNDAALGEMGDLSSSTAIMTGSPQFCPGINAGHNLALLSRDGALASVALGCPQLTRGGVYLIPNSALSGAVSFDSIEDKTSWIGLLSNQRFGSVLESADLMPTSGEELAVGAPDGLGPGSIYILPVGLPPLEYRIDQHADLIAEVKGTYNGDRLGEGFAVGIGPTGVSQLAVVEPGAGDVHLVTGPFSQGQVSLAEDHPLVFNTGPDVLIGDVSLSDLDGDGTEDIVFRSTSIWYGLLQPGTSSATATGSCGSADLCITSAAPRARAASGELDREDGVDLALSDTPEDGLDRVLLYSQIGRATGPSDPERADLILVGLSAGTGATLLPMPSGERERLLVGEYGLDFAGALDIGGIFLIDLVLLSAP